MNEKDSLKSADGSFGWRALFRALWYLLDGTRGVYLGWTLVLFLVHFYVVVPPFVLGKIVDFFISYRIGAPLTPFYLYISLFGVSFVLVSLIRLTVKKILGDLRSELMYRLKVKGFEKLLDFSVKWHDRESTGAKVQRIRRGLDAAIDLAELADHDVYLAIASLVGASLVFLFLKPAYVVFFFSYTVIFWFIISRFYQKITRLNDEYHVSLETASGSYIEGLSNILTIKTLGATKTFKTHIAAKESITKEYEIRIRSLYNNLWKTFQILNGITFAVFLFLVGQGVATQAITAGAIVIFYGYLERLTGSASDVIHLYENVMLDKSAIGRLMPIFWTKSTAHTGQLSFPEGWRQIVVKNANFHYHKQSKHDHTLSDINLTINRNQKVGVVGKTGSGKSTLAKLLVGLYEVGSGQYFVGGVNFYDIRHEEVTRQMTLVLQDSEMFNLTLSDNITLMREIDPVLLTEAIRISQLTPVIAKLPQGLDTVIGEKGYHLSGGERQRVGIARAIYKNPHVLIFDEATSSLDSKTEALIQEAVEKELADKTIITIAHRITTLKNVDTIYVFDEGRIVESGSFAQLSIDPNSHFAKLYTSQMST